MGLFNRNEEETTNDLLIVFDDEQKTSDIRSITSIEEDSVNVAGIYKIPIEDCQVTTGRSGRNYFYRAPSQSITETAKLAQLETNTVLSQITSYQEPMTHKSMDLVKGGLFFMLLISMILNVF